MPDTFHLSGLIVVLNRDSSELGAQGRHDPLKLVQARSLALGLLEQVLESGAEAPIAAGEVFVEGAQQQLGPVAQGVLRDGDRVAHALLELLVLRLQRRARLLPLAERANVAGFANLIDAARRAGWEAKAPWDAGSAPPDSHIRTTRVARI